MGPPVTGVGRNVDHPVVVDERVTALPKDGRPASATGRWKGARRRGAAITHLISPATGLSDRQMHKPDSTRNTPNLDINAGGR
jgi:hypothetical protein